MHHKRYLPLNMQLRKTFDRLRHPLFFAAFVLSTFTFILGVNNVLRHSTKGEPVSTSQQPTLQLPAQTELPQVMPINEASLFTLSIALQKDMREDTNYEGYYPFETTFRARIDSQGRYLGEIVDEDETSNATDVYTADTESRTTDSRQVLYFDSANHKYIARVEISSSPDNMLQTYTYSIGPKNNTLASLVEVATYKTSESLSFVEFWGIRDGKLLIFETAEFCRDSLCDGHEYAGNLYEIDTKKNKVLLAKTHSNNRIVAENTIVTKHAIFVEFGAGGGPYHMRIDLKSKKTTYYFDEETDLYDTNCYTAPLFQTEKMRVIYPSCEEAETIQLIQLDPETNSRKAFGLPIKVPPTENKRLNLTMSQDAKERIIVFVSDESDLINSFYVLHADSGKLLYRVSPAQFERGKPITLSYIDKQITIPLQLGDLSYDRVLVTNIEELF